MHPADHARLDRPSVDPTADVLGRPADRLFIYIMGSHNVLFSPISLVEKKFPCFIDTISHIYIDG